MMVYRFFLARTVWVLDNFPDFQVPGVDVQTVGFYENPMEA
jgi:hypothetical protein